MPAEANSLYAKKSTPVDDRLETVSFLVLAIILEKFLNLLIDNNKQITHLLMKKVLLLLVTFLAELTAQALPIDAGPDSAASTPQYTYNSATGALTLNWGEFNQYNNWSGDVINTSVKSVTATSEVSFTGDCSQLFYNFNHCESMDLSQVNTSEMTNAKRMFRDCSSLTSLDLSSWNVANVTDMFEMFCYCESLTSLNLSGWNTANVIDMGLMFYYCLSLSSIDLTGWDTSNVIDMYHMFNSCESLTSLDLSGFNTANVSSMTQMFYGCRSLTSLNLSGWDTSTVMTMVAMFSGCSSLTSLDLSNWNTANVISMDNMFNGCKSLTSLNISRWNTISVNDMQNMFSGCTGLTSLDISDWNTFNTWYMTNMFKDCTHLTTIYAGTGWTTDNVYGEWGEGLFTNCTALVGGMGTVYNENHTDKTYARIDGGPSAPGYFTSKSSVLRGDVNGDHMVNINDVTDLINYLISGDASLINPAAADCDLDSSIRISDVTTLIDYLLKQYW